jgi:hypothetical protein
MSSPLPSTHKQCILKSFYAQQHCYVFPKNLRPWRDLNPGLLAPEAGAMSTATRRQGQSLNPMIASYNASAVENYIQRHE